MAALPAVCILLLMLTVSSAVRIGIVGGGIGGASAAFFIRQIFKDDADIQLFEKKQIGGRVAVTEMNNFRFEYGATIINTKNEYMMRFIDLFGLTQKSSPESTFGLFDGTDLVFTSSSWSVINIAKLFWRYGYDVIKLRRLTDAALIKFSRIYHLLDSGAAYDTVEDLILAMDPSLTKLLGLPLSQYFRLSGLREQFVDELVTAFTRMNYGQPPNIHAFVGMVALAGAGADLTSVSGGNRQVAEAAVKASAATVHREEVLAIKYTGGTFLVTSSDAGDVTHAREVDIVVVAAPQTADHVTVRWEGLPVQPRFPGRYQNMSITLVDGELRPAAFAASSLPDSVLATAGCLAFNSIGRVQPVNETASSHSVHKLLTNEPAGELQLAELFSQRRHQQRHWWLAYPHYSSPAQLGNFTLHQHLYYLNSVEMAASAMEMSAIAAKNVANMAYARWYGRPPPDLSRSEHTEL